MKQTSLPLFVITLSALWIVGCNRQTDLQLSLETPKGYAPATAVAKTTWQDAIPKEVPALVETPAVAANGLAQFSGPFVLSPAFAVSAQSRIVKVQMPIQRVLSARAHFVKARHRRHHR